MSTVVILNPGAGRVRGRVTHKDADRNMRALLKEINLPGLDWCHDKSTKGCRGGYEGRYDYIVLGPRVGSSVLCFVVCMPGLPLERVRFTSFETQDCLEFPRLYVNGNSYYWLYAVSVLRDSFESFRTSANPE